jgi:hypothetical protein
MPKYTFTYNKFLSNTKIFQIIFSKIIGVTLKSLEILLFYFLMQAVKVEKKTGLAI